MNEITYHREGDYLIPDLIAPPAPKIGVWGMRRKRYLQQYHDGIYTGMLLSGKLNAHLEEIDRTAEDMFFQTGVTERLKAENQLEWVRQMNAIRVQAEEAVFHDLTDT
ncbi:MAG: TnpV protein [Ruminococcaceae bacterium]|nr:TnpV protein [Oscillospiraceae bacterium]